MSHCVTLVSPFLLALAAWLVGCLCLVVFCLGVFLFCCLVLQVPGGVLTIPLRVLDLDDRQCFTTRSARRKKKAATLARISVEARETFESGGYQ